MEYRYFDKFLREVLEIRLREYLEIESQISNDVGTVRCDLFETKLTLQ